MYSTHGPFFCSVNHCGMAICSRETLHTCVWIVMAGLIGAGTNNARLAGMLRGLSSYYYKEPTLLFLVRVAQGLVHMGKGLLNLCPIHTGGQQVSGKH